MLLTLLSSLLSSVPVVGSLVSALATTVNSVLLSIPLLGGLLAGLI
jgi:hypothetical protein